MHVGTIVTRSFQMGASRSLCSHARNIESTGFSIVHPVLISVRDAHETMYWLFGRPFKTPTGPSSWTWSVPGCWKMTMSLPQWFNSLRLIVPGNWAYTMGSSTLLVNIGLHGSSKKHGGVLAALGNPNWKDEWKLWRHNNLRQPVSLPTNEENMGWSMNSWMISEAGWEATLKPRLS